MHKLNTALRKINAKTSIFNIECTRIKRNSRTEKQRRITVSVWLFLKDIVFLWSFLRSLLNSEVPLEGSYIFIKQFVGVNNLGCL